MRAKFVNEGYGQKDKIRMEDIRMKSEGDHEKEIKLATTQAKIIKNPAKAKARAEAADDVFGEESDIAQIFHDRAADLGGGYVRSEASAGSLAPVKHAAKKGEKLEREYETDFLLPSEKGKSTFARGTGGAGGGFRRGGGGNTMQGLGIGKHFGKEEETREPKHSYGDSYILPIGKVNIGSGKSMHFNVKENWDEGTVEVWKSLENRKYKIIFSSGDYIPGVIGDTRNFQHDQNFSDMGSWKLVDWVPIGKIDELIRIYGNSIAGAVYK